MIKYSLPSILPKRTREPFSSFALFFFSFSWSFNALSCWSALVYSFNASISPLSSYFFLASFLCLRRLRYALFLSSKAFRPPSLLLKPFITSSNSSVSFVSVSLGIFLLFIMLFILSSNCLPIVSSREDASLLISSSFVFIALSILLSASGAIKSSIEDAVFSLSALASKPSFIPLSFIISLILLSAEEPIESSREDANADNFASKSFSSFALFSLNCLRAKYCSAAGAVGTEPTPINFDIASCSFLYLFAFANNPTPFSGVFKKRFKC